MKACPMCLGAKRFSCPKCLKAKKTKVRHQFLTQLRAKMVQYNMVSCGSEDIDSVIKKEFDDAIEIGKTGR